MINRILSPSKNSSFFLFGARGTGKSTWLRQEFLLGQDHIYIDLLNPDQEESFSKNPNLLKMQISAMTNIKNWVVIDEVQKVPKLLDVVHGLIEDKGTRFALTGSSARKLKRGHANMLGGRAFVYGLHPFTHLELASRFELETILQWGSLPKIFDFAGDDDKTRYLKGYAQTYLKEEILIEQVIRKLDPFRQFLEIAAQQNGDIVNYSNMARDVGVDTVTVQSYFQILEDTLVGYLLPAYHRSVRKRQRQNPKFYFFDLGVTRILGGKISQSLSQNPYGYGKAFEHFVILEVIRLNSYFEKDFRLSYLRTKDDAEVDLIVERPGQAAAFIEIKSAERVDERDVRTLRTLVKDLGTQIEAYCLSKDPVPKMIEGVRLLPWEQGLREIMGNASCST